MEDGHVEEIAPGGDGAASTTERSPESTSPESTPPEATSPEATTGADGEDSEDLFGQLSEAEQVEALLKAAEEVMEGDLEEVEVEWDALDKVEPPFTAEDAAGAISVGTYWVFLDMRMGVGDKGIAPSALRMDVIDVDDAGFVVRDTTWDVLPQSGRPSTPPPSSQTTEYRMTWDALAERFQTVADRTSIIPGRPIDVLAGSFPDATCYSLVSTVGEIRRRMYFHPSVIGAPLKMEVFDHFAIVYTMELSASSQLDDSTSSTATAPGASSSTPSTASTAPAPVSALPTP